MKFAPLPSGLTPILCCLALGAGCAPGVDVGAPGSGGAAAGSGAATGGRGGSGAATNSGGAPAITGGTTGSGGSTGATGGSGGSSGGATPGSGGATPGSGGITSGTGGRGGMTATGGRGGTPATGGRGGAVGTGGMSASGGAGGAPPPLDCGPDATVIENHGPPANRVNYVIVGDGYSQAELDTTLIQHVNVYMAKRFHAEIGQPYLRYRNFVNICVLKKASTPICGSSAFGCCGNDTSRLASCNNTAVNAAISSSIPASFMVDWKAVVLNGSSWWNSGGMLMYWSGGNRDADGAALHEGSHGFHQLADEYGGGDDSNRDCQTENPEVNSTHNATTTGGKWDMWLGYNQVGATGMQVATNTGFSQGSRYCRTAQFRPSNNSMMNSLFGDDPNTSFNAVSREQMAIGMWRYIVPIDSTEPAAGAVNNPAMLKVNVIDPAVINVDWTVDGMTTVNGGTTLNTSTLAPGNHTITAKAYDNATTDLVRYKSGTCPASVTGAYCQRTAWNRSTQTVSWTVTKN